MFRSRTERQSEAGRSALCERMSSDQQRHETPIRKFTITSLVDTWASWRSWKKKAKREIQVDKMMSKSENNHMVSLSYKHISSAVMTFYLFRHNVR